MVCLAKGLSMVVGIMPVTGDLKNSDLSFDLRERF